jgi:trigger factor
MAEATKTEQTAEDRKEQTVTIADSGPARKKLTIEIPESRIQATIEESFGRLQTEAALPGFRPGRAPMRLLHRRFNNSIREEVRGQLLSESYQQALEEHNLDVIGEPEIEGIEDLKLPESGPMTYVAEVEVAPEVTLPDLKGIAIKKPKIEVKKDDIDKEVNTLRERHGSVSDVSEGELAPKDFAMADVHIYAGENAGDDAEVIAHHHGTYVMIREGDDARGHVAGIVVEDLRDRMVGKKIGDEVTISMQGPASHENDKIKNKPITIKVKINRIERIEPAAIEKLVEQLGMESEKQLRDRVTAILETRRDRDVQLAMHKQVSEYLIEKVDLTLPEGLTSRQVERSLRRQRMELAYRGIPETEIEDKMAEARSESEDNARRELKLFFIIDTAAKALDIDVEDDELNGNIAMMAQQHGRRPEKLRQAMARNGELEYLYLQIREQKTLDKIIEDATITEVDGPIEEPAAGEDKPAKKSSKKSSKKSD